MSILQKLLKLSQEVADLPFEFPDYLSMARAQMVYEIAPTECPDLKDIKLDFNLDDIPTLPPISLFHNADSLPVYYQPDIETLASSCDIWLTKEALLKAEKAAKNNKTPRRLVEILLVDILGEPLVKNYRPEDQRIALALNSIQYIVSRRLQTDYRFTDAANQLKKLSTKLKAGDNSSPKCTNESGRPRRGETRTAPCRFSVRQNEKLQLSSLSGKRSFKKTQKSSRKVVKPNAPVSSKEATLLAAPEILKTPCDQAVLKMEQPATPKKLLERPTPISSGEQSWIPTAWRWQSVFPTNFFLYDVYHQLDFPADCDDKMCEFHHDVNVMELFIELFPDSMMLTV